MSFCVICTDLFDGVECLVATPCGHVFHSKCLSNWILDSETCPKCHRKMKESDLILLNINAAINPFGRNENAAENEKLLKETVKNVTNLRDTAEEYLDSITFSLASFQEVQMSMRNEITTAKDRFINFIHYKRKCRKLAQQNRNLMVELELLNDVKTVVNGTRKEAEKMFQETNTTTATVSDALKKLVTYCSVLKKELDASVEEEKTLRNDLTEMKKKYDLLCTKQRMSKKEASSSLTSMVRHSTPNKNSFKQSSNSFSMIPVRLGCITRPSGM